MLIKFSAPITRRSTAPVVVDDYPRAPLERTSTFPLTQNDSDAVQLTFILEDLDGAEHSRSSSVNAQHGSNDSPARSITGSANLLASFASLNVARSFSALNGNMSMISLSIHELARPSSAFTASVHGSTRGLRKASSSSVLAAAEFETIGSHRHRASKETIESSGSISSSARVGSPSSSAAELVSQSRRRTLASIELPLKADRDDLVEGSGKLTPTTSNSNKASRRSSTMESKTMSDGVLHEHEEPKNNFSEKLDHGSSDNEEELENSNSEVESDSESDDEEDDDVIAELKVDMHPSRSSNNSGFMLNPALSGLMESKKRRASIAVWSDSKLTELANQKSSGSVSQKNSGRFNKSVEVEASMESLVSEDSDIFKHPLQDSRLLPLMFAGLSFRQIWRLRRVCAAWNKVICNSAILLKTVDVSSASKTFDDTAVNSLMSRVGTFNIEMLILKNCWKVTNRGLLEISNNCPSLIVLDVSGCWDINDDGVCAIASRCPMLRSIDLSNCRKVTDRSLLALTNQCPQLREVLLSYCKQLTDSTITYFGNFAANLRRINLQRCLGITDAAWRIFNGDASSPRKYKLQEIVLSDCSFLTDASILDIAEACTNLQVLNISFCCAVTEAVFTQALIPMCPRMRILDASFCGNAISDDVVSAMAVGWHHLERLSVRGCVRLTNAGVLAMTRDCSSMRVLNMSGCKNVTEVSLSQVPKTWQLLSAQGQIVDNNGVSANADIYGSGHMRRCTAP